MPTQKPSPQYAAVAVNLPIHGTFTYQIPEPLRSSIVEGIRVLVPFGNRTITAFVVEYPAAIVPGVAAKPIKKVLDHHPVLTPELLKLTRWISEYYFAPLGEAINAAVPKGIDTKSAEVATLTEKGKMALPYVTDPTGKSILAALNGKKPVKLSTLEKKFKGSGVSGRLKKFSREGLIVQSKIIQEGTTKQRTERFYSLNDTSSPVPVEKNKRAPKQAEILRFLSGGERSLAEIRSAFKNPTSILNKLEEKGLVGFTERTSYRSPLKVDFHMELETESHKTLTNDQLLVFQKINEWVELGKFRSVLLHGVTGSGKTEIYLQTISEIIQKGKQAIFLVPEISLTPQMIFRFQARFGKRIALIHSGLSQGERYDEWQRIRNGEVDIAVGARSAIFAPFQSLGAIIVDEEHETSFKQEESPRYHARDLALMRGKQSEALVILGSATPSMESIHNCHLGKHEYLMLKNRISPHPMPIIEMLDMRTAHPGQKGSIISKDLRQAMKEALERKEQIFLFLNRRGTANFLQCTECGTALTCSQCSVTLTYHGRVREMRCHYCNYFAPAPNTCPSCGGSKIFFMGCGTQKLEDEARSFFPEACIARMDRDSVRTKGSFFQIYQRLKEGGIDILIGTQMIAKGHDFPDVTLVGIMNADASINVPDFRSTERTFQLISQVSGRSGRGEKPGRVIVQSYNPDHYVYRYIANYDFDGFVKKEGELRKLLSYPPYSRIAVLAFESESDEKAEKAAEEIGEILKAKADQYSRGIEILGPSKAMIHKVKNVYRWRLLLKGREMKPFRQFLSSNFSLISGRKWYSQGVKVSLDVDPAHIA